MKNNGIAAVRGYKKHKSYGCGRPQIVPPNHLNREFVVNTPDTSWVTLILPTSVLGKAGYIWLWFSIYIQGKSSVGQ